MGPVLQHTIVFSKNNKLIKSSCILLIGLLITTCLSAQYVPEKVNKKALSLYEEALNRASDDKFNEGIIILLEAIRIDPKFVDGYLSLAGMYGELKKYAEAIEYYEKAIRIDSSYTIK